MRVNTRTLVLVCAGLVVGVLVAQLVVMRTERDRLAEKYESFCRMVAFTAGTRSDLYRGQPWSIDHEDTAGTLVRFLRDCAKDPKSIDDAVARVKTTREPAFGGTVRDPSELLRVAVEAERGAP